ncbi:MAG: cobaltochelatase subunit CobN [Burkholderiales bacterium]|nr:cobaltochelatase subunit CobN [Burkholderiales bacterium]
MPAHLFAVLALLALASLGAQARELLVLTAAPVQAGKFHVLDDIGKPLGWRVRHVLADRLSGEEGPALFKDADLVLLDIPYDPVVEAVERKLGRSLAQSGKPWLKVQTERHAARGMPDADAGQLWLYYSNGGRRNFTSFFRYLNGLRPAPAPILFPKSGIYHPDYKGTVFKNAVDFFAWKGVKPQARPPVIGFAIHQRYLSSELTHFIDHTIRAIEARGALALAFYTPFDDEGALERLLRFDGKLAADALINSQIMLRSDLRRAEFDRLGIPVLQAMPYRRGDVAEWARDPAGVHLMDVPFYLAQPEYAGVMDAMTAAATRKGDGQIVAIPGQVEAVVDKALNLVRLQRTPNAEKRVALFYWNYPPGETNLGASYLNVPRSVSGILAAMHAAGYRVEMPAAEALIPALQRLLRPYYRDGELRTLLQDGLAASLPLSRYRAWFDGLPPAVRERIRARWGEPEDSAMVLRDGGEPRFVIPRLALGNFVAMPQPPRGERRGDKEKALYHDTATPVNHFYLAVYLWARRTFGANALVHLGTHGTQEWMPGKERGLAATDDALLPVGDLPVIYPYIVDDVGEAVQAKRRGRALTLSHQTAPFAPAGLHNELNGLHALVHEWQNLTEGPVRAKTGERILAQAGKLHFHRDLGISDAQAKRDFPAFLQRLHDWLHELALASQPQGMHTLGATQDAKYRLGTVMQMLGKEFVPLVDADPGEVFAEDYRKLTESAPYRFLQRHVAAGEPLAAGADARLAPVLARARDYYAALEARPEMTNLLLALEGRHVPAGYGGDPIRNPDSLPTGRNLYGFDPSRVPTRAAYDAAREALDKLVAAYRAKHGRPPAKLAFNLWSVETMRHFGVLEAQALYALGVRPKWNPGGQVTGVELIPREELGRPRIDVVLSATGLYRDHFPNVMRHLAEAVVLAGKAADADNVVRENSARLAARLKAGGMEGKQAERYAATRIFANASGDYGAGINNAILESGTWDKEDKLAGLYLGKLQYAYGTDMKEWGTKLPGLNLYAENLKGVQAAALSRTSNLYGMLTTDDPFQYLGGIALAVRHLTGKSPELYISNLREAANPKAETASEFLARELRTRQFHPGWIEGMQREGYSGTTELLDSINNFWGWQVTAPDLVRADQWQEFAEVYVRDKYKLGMKEWFEHANPAALAQMMERMLEAVRKDYWRADAATVSELARRYRDLAQRFDVRTDNRKFAEFVEHAAGFGLSAPAPAVRAAQARPAARAEPVPAPPPPVQGMKLARIAPPAAAVIDALQRALALALLLAAVTLGGLAEARRGPRPRFT